MLHLLRVPACLALLFAVAQVVASPQEANNSCAVVTAASERLACYDAAFPPIAGAVDMASEKERALKEFGLNKSQLRDRDPDRMSVLAPDRIEALVARVSQRPTGERLITLDSGQVWLLTEATMKGHLAIGERVTIREALFGSHILLTPNNIALRARRVQ